MAVVIGLPVVALLTHKFSRDTTDLPIGWELLACGDRSLFREQSYFLLGLVGWRWFNIVGSQLHFY